MTERRVLAGLWVGAVLLALALCGANLLLGEVNQDEGWYLYAARLVHEGRLPYADFAFTQGPVMAFAYALGWPLAERWGVAGGRLFTAWLGLACTAGAAWLAWRLAPPGRRGAAALLAFTFVGVNVFQSYFTTIVKTYALTGLLLTAGFAALTFIAGKGGATAALLSGVLLGLAAATRTSAGMVLPVVFLALAWPRRGRPAGAPRAGFWFGLGAVLAGGGAYLPFLLWCRDDVIFGLVKYHAGRDMGGPLQILVYKAGFISRLAQAYFVPAAIALAMPAWHVFRRFGGRPPAGDAALPRAALEPVLWAGCLAVTLMHLAAPFPYDDYQTIVFPIFAAALAVAVARHAGERVIATAGVGLLLCAMAAFSSPRNQDWLAGRRDRIWWPVRTVSSLGRLQAAGRRLRAMTRPGDRLLTQDAYLAVEAGRRLPPGLELGPFSYFPDMSADEAKARHVVNRVTLKHLIETSDASAAALSDWSFAIRLPDVARAPDDESRDLWRAVERRYERVGEEADFGHADTRLRIYRLRTAPEDPASPGKE